MAIAVGRLNKSCAGLADKVLARWAAQQAIGVLLDTTATGSINFAVAGISVTAHGLAEVGRAIRDGKIAVTLHRDANMSYDPKTNVMNFDSPNLTTTKDRGGLIHEATHAVFDLAGFRKLLKMESEQASYIAQCIYLRKNDIRFQDGKKVKSDGSVGGIISSAAFPLADKIIAGGTLDAADLKKLRTGIIKSDFYEGITEKKYKWVTFDGI